MIIPPLPTPFDHRGVPDWVGFGHLATVLEPEVDGFLVYGSTGEGVHLTTAERQQGLAHLQVARPLFVGVMEENLAQAVTAVEAAARTRSMS